MTLEALRNAIYEYIETYLKAELHSNPQIQKQHITTEIIARLFVLSFDVKRPIIDKNKQLEYGEMGVDNDDLLTSFVDKEKKFAFDNINSYNTKYYDNRDDTLGLLHRRIKKYLNARENKIKHILEEKRENHVIEMMNNRGGRSLDMASLFFISENGCDSTYDLLKLVFDDRICDSKKASDNTVAEAYTAFDAAYRKAKELSKSEELKDKEKYIFRWVNFHRLETEYQLSIIPQIAQAILKSKHTQERKWNYDDLLGIFGGYSYNNLNFYAYQILTNYNNIELLFSAESVWNISDIVILNYNLRRIETQTVSFFRKYYYDAFDSFLNGNIFAIDEIFRFCVDDYPIIEQHNDSDLYISNKLNKPKIKQIRKIASALIDTKNIKSQFKEVP